MIPGCIILTSHLNESANNESAIIAAVRAWVDALVVGENLCPFARRELVRNRVRFAVTACGTEQDLLATLSEEMEILHADSEIETTLLIHPHVLTDFADYNQFLDLADALLVEQGLEGVFQIASFHPHYQFVDTAPDDAENYSNRSPYPLLHLLREESLDKAIAGFGDIEAVPLRNIEHLNRLGARELKRRWEACRNR